MNQKSILVPWDKYQRLIKQTSPKKDVTVETPLTTIKEEEPVDDALSVDMVVEAVPKNVRNRVRALLSHITNNGRLTWNKQGEIHYEGQNIPGSHITDLVKDSQYKYKHFHPVGHDVFYRALKDMNIPTGLLGHQEKLQPKKTPPGIRAPQTRPKEKLPIKWLKF